MKAHLLLGFFIIPFFCELTRHSDDVLKRDKIYIEGHRGVSEGQKNHNTKEAILNAIDKGIETIEIDVWLTSDKQIAVFHDLGLSIYNCKNNINYKVVKLIGRTSNFTWSELQECVTKEGNNKIPLLEDIMKITKGKIFMNLEIKDPNEEIWEMIQELIEKYEYYDQISICSFEHKYFQRVENYNKQYGRKIVFGFLYWEPFFLDLKKTNHQITLNALNIYLNKDIVKKAHENGMTVGAYFFDEPKEYNSLFEIGVDVIITDYPIKVQNQLNEYNSDQNYSEGCESIEKNINKKLSCRACKYGYELVKIKEENRNLCKLKYEIDPDLYSKDKSGINQEKNIFAIKMLLSPIGEHAICLINGKTIFYFEWRFDLYGYDTEVKKFILNETIVKQNYNIYSQLTEKHIKKLNFSLIEIYVNDKLINQTDFLCKDLYDTVYYTTYIVMGAHCYIYYNGEQKNNYNVQFKLFDDNYLSFVTYDNKYLQNEDSWGRSERIDLFSSLNSNSLCNTIKDPFQERISCIDKINNCMYCENENKCNKCNYGFSLFNDKCHPSTNFQNNVKYFTSDNEINYYSCSSMINGCEECSYDDFSFNKFHCTKCTDENIECNDIFQSEENINTTVDGSIELKNYSRKEVDYFISISLVLLLILFV